MRESANAPTVVALLFALGICAVSDATAQNTLRVPGQYATIQAAIDAAQADDTVLVAPGRYRAIDFKFKRITVKSSQGPFLTSISGGGATGVTMNGAGGMLEGFTISGFAGRPGVQVSPCPSITCPLSVISPFPTAARGAGIFASATGVVIQNNIITNNGFAQVVHGAGILVTAPGALITGNFIARNRAGSTTYQVACRCGGSSVFGLGGGILSLSSIFVSSNVIANNTAVSGGGIALFSGTLVNNMLVDNVGDGVGPYFFGLANVQVTNNTIVNNTGFGISGGGPQARVVNSIIRGNTAGQIRGTSAIVTFSNVQGGYAGMGNFDADPQFVDSSRGDYHLLATSSSRDVGDTNTLLPPTDFEGNVRIAGPAVDVGADEFDDRLYVTGDSRPGRIVHVKLIGSPGAIAYWAYSLNPSLQNPPLQLPQGAFYLAPPFFVQPAGAIPASGILIIPVPLPAFLPSGFVIPLQGLIGPKLTNPWVQVVR